MIPTWRHAALTLSAGALALALAAPAALPASAGPRPEPAAVAAAQTPPEFSNPADPINVIVGESFVIVLESNRTTGYSWQLAGAVDPAVVRLDGSEYVASNPGLIGSPGRERWTFTAVGPGSVQIPLVYVRPWETNQPPAREADFTVNVNPRPGPTVYSNPAQPINVAVGQLFEIALQSNHSTGYQWQISPEVDPNLLRVIRHTYTPGNPGLPGGGGADRFIFVAQGAGSTSINLIYIRPWEHGVPPANAASFTVNIQ